MRILETVALSLSAAVAAVAIYPALVSASGFGVDVGLSPAMQRMLVWLCALPGFSILRWKATRKVPVLVRIPSTRQRR